MERHREDLTRRGFLVKAAATAGIMATGAAFGQDRGSKDSSKGKVLHIIGHSHIDAAWLWPWRDGADSVLDTFRSALNRMNETPGFCYSHSSSAHYRWTERADPVMFDEIKERIRQKRWEVTGGWPVEPDCNIPSTESFVRQSLYGKEYCQRALGVNVKIGMNPDSFGHAAGLPTILKSADFDYYVFMRPQENEMDLPLLFWWEGPDGSRVLTLRIWRGYDTWGETTEMIQGAATHLFAPGSNHGAIFLGVGDHGGAVTKEQIQKVLELQGSPGLPELRWSTLSSFFEDVERSQAFAHLPVIKGELEHHARGCYSAYGEGKYLNRRAERSLGEAEVISVATGLAVNHPYPGENFADSWWKVAFCQFHDLLAGTALYSDYIELRDSLGYACEIAQTSKIEALEAMAMQVDLSRIRENALFLFNPLPWPRKVQAEVITQAQVHSADLPPMHLESNDGQRYCMQWRPSPSMTNFFPQLSAWVDLPACGYKVLELCHGEAPATERYSSSFRISSSGFGIASLKAQDGAELLSGPVGLVVISDTSDTWGHDVVRYREEMGRPMFVSSRLIEDGSVVRVTRHRARWMNSDIMLNITEFAGSEMVELHFIVDWREREQILKLEIPTVLAQPTIYAKVPGAVLERRTNGDEEPYQDWVAIQGLIGGRDYTVGIMNDSTYSYDCLDGLFRTVLIRSAPFARHNPNQVPRDDDHAWQDQGRQERTFWLIGGQGKYPQLTLDRRSEEAQTPAEHVMDSAHAGKLPREQSFLEVMPGNVQLLALKHAEPGNEGVIIRLQERSGLPTQASLKSAQLGLERVISLRPWELKTILITHKTGGKTELRELSSIET